ncbi:hypothetical protein MMAD_08910 [Mycolicibacterium madagascariense]|uniref:Uncharacterized protein n=1 Tax=Mycolicibacterium madagascariense TaxID=212765 RepID=A0A7I7XAA2_9MYCO|nr:hypothetical protein [Mycolicibacterium madagascariense]MCV7014886.1 hypothetical protein [Mycolicibacterium madagascariense]BBZ26596.1 hypothetical protein MMAD_08910 [Mycolicibacterium madagascariense]
MGIVFRLAELLLMLLPVIGVVMAGVGMWRRTQQQQERPDEPRLDQPRPDHAAPRGTPNVAALWRMITRTIDEHSRTDTRWLEYELDVERLLDFPLMTDTRAPLTAAFHKAKLRADLMRPARAEDLLDDRVAAAQYLAAVEEYTTAFDAAETEAIRTRRNDFSAEAQQRIARARSLLSVASDSGAAQPEREQAYTLACKELDGLVVLPAATRNGIERGIAGQLDG